MHKKLVITLCCFFSSAPYGRLDGMTFETPVVNGSVSIFIIVDHALMHTVQITIACVYVCMCVFVCVLGLYNNRNFSYHYNAYCYNYHDNSMYA